MRPLKSLRSQPKRQRRDVAHRPLEAKSAPQAPRGPNGNSGQQDSMAERLERLGGEPAPAISPEEFARLQQAGQIHIELARAHPHHPPRGNRGRDEPAQAARLVRGLNAEARVKRPEARKCEPAGCQLLWLIAEC